MLATRRLLLRLGGAGLLAPLLNGVRTLPALAQAQASSPVWRHGVSLFGDLKYPAGFKHFDYVNPNAPKGGVGAADRVRHLRQFQYRGRRREGQSRRRRLDFLYDTLLIPALDEISTEYGLLAEAVELSRTISAGRPIGCGPRRAGTTASR